MAFCLFENIVEGKIKRSFWKNLWKNQRRSSKLHWNQSFDFANFPRKLLNRHFKNRSLAEKVFLQTIEFRKIESEPNLVLQEKQTGLFFILYEIY